MNNNEKSSSYCNNPCNNPTNVFAIFAKILSIILRLAINTKNKLFPFFAATIINTESMQPMASVSAQFKSSGSTFTISTNNLKNIIANAIRTVCNASYSFSFSALFGMSPFSWLMDSTCCNHMTPHSSLFSQLNPAPHPLNICTANGSTMFGHNIDSISTSNLSVPRVFNVPNISYNLVFVGQLAELDYRITFNYSRCIVQDPRMGQELGTGPKVGRMFPMDNLRLPPVAHVSILSLALWHA